MIEVNNVTKIFNRGKANEVTAVKELMLNVGVQDYLVVVGSNGSGKSTLLNLIAGSTFATSGEIKLDGQGVTRQPDYSRSQWIARVFQNPLSGTAPDLSILDNFRLAALRTQPKGLGIGTTDAFKRKVQDKIA